MKKLQLFALLMLLSTGYITQADQGGQGGQRSGQGGQGGQQGGHKKGGHKGNKGPMMSQQEIEKALGSSLSFEAISDYAKLYAEDISTLSASSEPAVIQPVMEKGRVVNEGLRLLLPNPEKGSNQLPADGGTSRSGGPMKGKKQPPARNNQ